MDDVKQEQAKREFEVLIGAPTGGAAERGLIPHFNYLAALEFAKYLQEELPEAFEKFKAMFVA